MQNLLSGNKLIIGVVLFLLLTHQTHNAQTIEKSIKLGQIITITSEVLNEDREIFIYLPVAYEKTEAKYPVIYVLDGRANFAFSATVSNFLSLRQRMPQSIVVGIPNTDRMRDFTPIKVIDWPTSGGADNFLKFMEEELIPYIDDNYRTQSYKTLYGHSLCGMFAIYTLFEKPEIFNSFIAVSPYLQLDNQIIVDKVEEAITERKEYKKSLFVTLGNEPEYIPSLTRFEKLLSNKTIGLSWEISKREKEDHMSVPLKSMYDGLEFIYSDWRLPNDVVIEGAESIKKHYSKISNKYGYPIQISEAALNVIGYRFLNNGEIEKAIKVFKYNIELYPESANVYDSYGEALEKAGKKEDAFNNYKVAVEMGTEKNDRNLKIYKENMNRVKSANK